jgi:plastocyanin
VIRRNPVVVAVFISPVKKLLALGALGAALAVPAAGAAVTKTVTVKDDKFVKNLVVVHKGDSVKWTWKGKHRHNVFGMPGNPVHFHSPSQSKGTYRKRFKKTGTYKFQCTYHTAMKMTVKVIP